VEIRRSGENPAPRIARLPGNYLAFHRGAPLLLIENDGARWRAVMAADPSILREAAKSFVALLQLPSPLRPFREIVVEYCDGVRPLESPLGEILRSLGFTRDKNQTLRKDIFS